MCGKNGWCSKIGLKKRKEGMYLKESRDRKFYIAFCFGSCAVIFGGIGAFQVFRYQNASRINADFSDYTADHFDNLDRFNKCHDHDILGHEKRRFLQLVIPKEPDPDAEEKKIIVKDHWPIFDQIKFEAL